MILIFWQRNFIYKEAPHILQNMKYTRDIIHGFYFVIFPFIYKLYNKSYIELNLTYLYENRL